MIKRVAKYWVGHAIQVMTARLAGDRLEKAQRHHLLRQQVLWQQYFNWLGSYGPQTGVSAVEIFNQIQAMGIPTAIPKPKQKPPERVICCTSCGSSGRCACRSDSQ